MRRTLVILAAGALGALILSPASQRLMGFGNSAEPLAEMLCGAIVGAAAGALAWAARNPAR